jgi:hypothetical protein
MSIVKPPHNPYSAPAATTPLAAPRVAHFRGAPMKWVYAIMTFLWAALAVVMYGGTWLDLSRDAIHGAGVVIDGPLRWAVMIVGLMWIHQAWTAVDSTRAAAAVGRFFIPFYNVYWTFSCNLRLCRELESGGAPARGPRHLAILGGILYFVAPVLLLSPLKRLALIVSTADLGVWVLYMFACDRAIERYLARRASGAE